MHAFIHQNPNEMLGDSQLNVKLSCGLQKVYKSREYFADDYLLAHAD
jgi:hypothetical protein